MRWSDIEVGQDIDGEIARDQIMQSLISYLRLYRTLNKILDWESQELPF